MSPDFLFSAFPTPFTLFSHLKARRHLETNLSLSKMSKRRWVVYRVGEKVSVIQFQALLPASHLVGCHLKSLSLIFPTSRMGIIEWGCLYIIGSIR